MKFLVSCFLVAALAASSYGLQCYQCLHTDPGAVNAQCRDAAAAVLADCPPNANDKCFASFLVNANTETIVRSCLPAGGTDGCETDAATGIRGFVCSGNGCNNQKIDTGCSGAGALTSFTVLTFISFIVAYCR